MNKIELIIFDLVNKKIIYYGKVYLSKGNSATIFLKKKKPVSLHFSTKTSISRAFSLKLNNYLNNNAKFKFKNGKNNMNKLRDFI